MLPGGRGNAEARRPKPTNIVCATRADMPGLRTASRYRRPGGHRCGRIRVFRSGSRGLFVGVFIRPSERNDLIDEYRIWEQRVRKSSGLTNELKGHAVTDTWARRLVRDVLARDGHLRVRYLAFAVDVSRANLDAMDVQRDIFLDDYGGWATDLRNNGGNATWVDQHAEWARTRPSVQLLKLVTLGTIITTLIEHALPQAILGGFDEELEHLQILIDRGYVKHDDISHRRELLRNAILTSRTPTRS